MLVTQRAHAALRLVGGSAVNLSLRIYGGIVCTAVVLVAACTHPHLDHRQGCKAEDMIEVVLTQDAYDWHSGEHACVHIENLEDGR